MRRFLLIAMVMFTLPMFAQNYTMRLASVYSDDGFESWDYIYPSAESVQITCINELDFLTGSEVIDSLFYDEKGNITKLATWQKLESGEWFYACYVDYTYDERNLRTSRTNYNNFGSGKFELGGVYKYSYDEEGRMIEWSLDFGMEEFQKAYIEYNEEGLKVSETALQYSYMTYSLENLYLLEYEYDENGNVLKENEFSWNINVWEPQPYRIWEYDEYNNCILEEQRTLAGTTQDRRVYNYDTSVLASDVFYYENPEQDWPPLPVKKTNLLKSFEFYAQNDSNELSYVTTYNIGYETGEFGVAVEEVAFLSSVYPNPAQDYVMVESSEAEYVEVVDMYGRVVFSSEMSETVKVDMSEFASGIYFVKLQANGATSVQKIMKK